MTPNEYRKRHNRCKYCRYLKLIIPRGSLTLYSYEKCVVKDKVIRHPMLLRLWCRVYDAKEVDFE